MPDKEFQIINYNVHSLIRFDVRMEHLLHELHDTSWDLLAFSETWREERSEQWFTKHGHTWFGSGDSKGQRGVGFVLHSRWRHSLFKPISDRAAVLDFCAHQGIKIRAIAVYMPLAAEP